MGQHPKDQHSHYRGIRKSRERESSGGLAVKDLTFSLLWHRFDTWPRNFYMLQEWPKTKRRLNQLIYVFLSFATFSFFLPGIQM